MITAIRRLVTSKVGAAIALTFLVIIGFAFVLSDVNTTGQGQVAQGSVARVGEQQISINDLRQRVTRAYQAERQQNPGLSMEQFVRGGAFDRLFKEMTDIYALHAYAQDIGIGIDKTAIDAIIARNPAFAGINGSFDQTAYTQALQQSGTTPARFRSDLEIEALVRQLVGPVGLIPSVPRGIAVPYAALLLEQRAGQAVFIPASRFAPTAAPTPAQLTAFYGSQRARYLIPERRSIRYAILDEGALKAVPAVTPAEIEADFRANAAQYAAKETRRFTQVIAGSKAVADRIAAAARSGTSLGDAARAASLAATPVNAASQSDFASATNAAVARAAFTADTNAVVGPLQVPLGWVVLHVDVIDRQSARTLAQVSDQIRTVLTTRKRQEAMVDLFNGVQDALNSGATVSEVAQENGLRIVTTPPLLPNGSAPGNASYRPDPLMPALLGPAFQVGEGDHGQVITLQDNRVFALVEVAQVTPAAPPPLASVSDAVTADWRRSEGGKVARARARQILAATERGTALSAAAAAAGVGGAVQPIGGRRLSLTSREGRVPPEIALLFSMPQGSAKTLELPGNVGWMVIRLDRVIRGDATGEREQGLVNAVQQQFSGALAGEYVDVLVEAARRAHPVSVDQAALATLREQLGGGAAPAN